MDSNFTFSVPNISLREQMLSLLQTAVREAAVFEGLSVDQLFRRVVGERLQKALQKRLNRRVDLHHRTLVDEDFFNEIASEVLDKRVQPSMLARLCEFHDDVYIPHINASDWRRNKCLAKPFASELELMQRFALLLPNMSTIETIDDLKSLEREISQTVGLASEENKLAHATTCSVAWLGGLYGNSQLFPRMSQDTREYLLAVTAYIGVNHAVEANDIAHANWCFGIAEKLYQERQSRQASPSAFDSVFWLMFSRKLTVDKSNRGELTILTPGISMREAALLGATQYKKHLLEAPHFFARRIEDDLAWENLHCVSAAPSDQTKREKPAESKLAVFSLGVKCLQYDKNGLKPEWHSLGYTLVRLGVNRLINTPDVRRAAWHILNEIRRSLISCNTKKHLRWANWYNLCLLLLEKEGLRHYQEVALCRLTDIFDALGDAGRATVMRIALDETTIAAAPELQSDGEALNSILRFLLKRPPSVVVA